MAEGEVKKVSCQDLQMVKDLIECCLQLYMSRKEVIQTLEQNARIDPGFTELVWQKLEEENTEFFKAYDFRFKVKNQISVFNQLLQKQVELMQGISSSSESNSSLQQTPCYPSTILPNMRVNDSISLPDGSVDLSTDSQMAMLHTINAPRVKMEPSFSGGSELMFHSNDICQEQALSSLINPGLDEFCGLSPIQQQFGLSDLTADFSQSNSDLGLIESFSTPQFLGSEFNGLPSLSERKCEDENRVSEGRVNIDNF